MRRRELIAGATAFVSASLGRAYAQQAHRRPRVGVLIFSSPERDPNTQSFLEGLRQLGYADGRNVTLEYRFRRVGRSGFPELAAELAQARPDVDLRAWR